MILRASRLPEDRSMPTAFPPRVASPPQAATLADLALAYCSTRHRLERSRRAYEADQGAVARTEAVLIRAMLRSETPCILFGDRGYRVLASISPPPRAAQGETPCRGGRGEGGTTYRIESFPIALAGEIPLLAEEP
jgi:hypothetical protein